ncbi:MAG: outer membrane autotransporter, partial [Candidatus Peregrinibacteria bacterium Greene0416_19]
MSAGTWTLNDDSDQTVDFDGQALFSLTILSGGGASYDNIIVANNGQLLLSGALVITNGNLDLDTNNEALSVTGNVTLADDADATLTTGDNMSIGGNLTVNDAATLTVSGGTLTFNGTADQTIDLDDQRLNNLTLNNTGGGTSDDIIIANNSQLLLSGALTITLGNLDLTTNTEPMVVDKGITLADAAQATLTTNSNVTASGTITVNNAATITVTAGTWTLNDDSDQTVDLDGQSLYGLTINNTGGGTNDDIVIAADGQLLLSGALTITLGNLDLTTNTEPMVVDRGITLADAAQATLTTNSNVTASGTITVNDAATITVSAGTWTLNDDSDQTVDLDGQSLYGLTINNTGGGTNDDIVIAADGQLNLSGALTITLGNLDLTTNTETMVVDRGITLADAAQATLTTNSNVTASGTITVNDAATITVSAGTWTL